ncbi:MAG: hypothetical protein BGO12_18295 [Verrucomicrobia bacterium 61-8]|nr:hypothetical protein [Verrucomicrobiota bacterium]OJU99696.1 MAG: hypothetical protein BGO12_18295 [Verrucomicrobia bacterium 61-8]
MTDVILDRNGEVVANLRRVTFDRVRNAYLGDIEFVAAPFGLRDLLARLEEIVEDQTFALLDDVQSAVDAFDLTVQFGDHTRSIIRDLYVNKSGGFSFRLECSNERKTGSAI